MKIGRKEIYLFIKDNYIYVLADNIITKQPIKNTITKKEIANLRQKFIRFNNASPGRFFKDYYKLKPGQKSRNNIYFPNKEKAKFSVELVKDEAKEDGFLKDTFLFSIKNEKSKPIVSIRIEVDFANFASFIAKKPL